MKKTILDLGCGVGDQLMHYYPTHQVIGVDIDPSNIEMCKKKMPHGTFLLSAIEDIDIPSLGKIDTILCTEVLEHVTDWKQIIQMLESCTPETRLTITVPHHISEKKLLAKRPHYWQEIGHQHFFTGKELRQALEKSGWHVTTLRRANASLYFELLSLFKRNAPCIRNTYYEQILPLPLTLFYQLFRPNLFHTRLKWLVPLWIITLPVGRILDIWYGAGIQIQAKKITHTKNN